VVPPDHDDGYSEHVVRMPHCYQCNDRKRPQDGQRLTREACGLRDTDFVFCCFNQSYKLGREVFEIWMRVLSAVPGSALWLLDDNASARSNLLGHASRYGVSPERLVFAPYRPLQEHLGRYALADLALDTFPYTSHTTASDALWVGCPLVTMIGETFASRVAASLLRNAQLGELVAGNAHEYEDMVVALARQPTRLDTIRRRLAQTRTALPLFDTPTFAAALEAAYERMSRRFADGDKPEAFDIGAN
jgi:predicted O-linked N-acetylglucosamine transferase (SPINDLY family)